MFLSCRYWFWFINGSFRGDFIKEKVMIKISLLLGRGDNFIM